MTAAVRFAVVLASTLGLGAALTPGVAGAEPGMEDAPGVGPGHPSAPPLDRTWLYAGDAQIAAPMQALARSRLTYTSTDSVTRPFASNVATPGAMFELGGEVGLLPRLSLEATGVSGEGGAARSVDTGGTAGLRVSVLPSAWAATRLVVTAGYLRELSGGNGAWARASFEQDAGRARFACTLHGEHVFADGRDGVDVMVVLGTTVRVVGPLRFGVEYVGQDLEETVGDQAEGGPRHFAGPTASVRLLDDRLSIVGGPSFGLARAPSMLGRVGVAYSF